MTTYVVDDLPSALFAVSLTHRPKAATARLMLEFAQRATHIEVWADGVRIPLHFNAKQSTRDSWALSAELDPARSELIALARTLRLDFRSSERGTQSVTLATDGMADAFDGPPASDIDARERRSELSAAWARAANGPARRLASATNGRVPGAPALVTGRIWLD